MLSEFKSFLIKQNVLALAIAVVIGTHSTLSSRRGRRFHHADRRAFTPGGEWQTATWNVGPVKFGVGDFMAALVNFIIIGFVAWRISKALIKPIRRFEEGLSLLPECRSTQRRRGARTAPAS